MGMLFGNGTGELSASFVGLRKTNRVNQTQELGDGIPEKCLKANRDKQQSFSTHWGSVSWQPALMLCSLPWISKDERAFLCRTGFSKKSLY